MSGTPTGAARHAGWLPAIGAAAILLPGIGQGLWDPWETHYAEVARRIAVDGDWVTLRWGSPDSGPAEARHDFLFFSKPALTFWLVAASFHVFGVSEAAARLPIALLAAAGIVGVFFYLRRIAGFRAALLAAAAMLGAPLYAMLGRHAMTDIPFVAPMTVGTLAFAAVLLDPRTSPNHSYVGYLCLGAATLAKGLLGFLLPGASLLVLLLIMTDYSFLRDRRRLRRLAIGCGAVVGAALAIGWSLGG
ncbi:MAG: glycosyltransferase family 39 protein, partial [Myxococcota bacterium]|nr:glycosyltransferase family 39 protein [Myxococcota bacterium]